MKKKVILCFSLLLTLCLLSGCMLISGSRLESMFGSGKGSQTAQATAASSGDTVTITREEYEDLSRFSELVELYHAAEELFYKEPDYTQIVEYAARGLLAGLDDPYSFYYNPEEFEQLFIDDEGKYTGIGVMILSNGETKECVISRVFKGSPAEAAGVMRGDILYRVEEDLFVTSENLTEAVNIMRGEPGTSVNVTFLRNGEEMTFNILRQEISVNQVESTMLTPEIGYIAMYEFAGEAEKEFESSLTELTAEGAKGVIIDLRDNSGGWVEQARYIADLFLDEGELCHLVYRDGETYYYRTTAGKTDVKIVLLVNEMSASSSEILTGALKDRAGATVVGTTTFGKGVVQDVLPVGTRGAGYQITIARYITPNGYEVDEVGIDPDVVAERTEGDPGVYDFADLNKDSQLRTALEVMKEKLQ